MSPAGLPPPNRTRRAAYGGAAVRARRHHLQVAGGRTGHEPEDADNGTTTSPVAAQPDRVQPTPDLREQRRWVLGPNQAGPASIPPSVGSEPQPADDQAQRRVSRCRLEPQIAQWRARRMTISVSADQPGNGCIGTPITAGRDAAEAVL